MSIRVNVTFAAGSFALREMSTRPTDVAAQSVPASLPRPSAAVVPPCFVVPYAIPVSTAPPICTKSPHSPVKSRSLVPN